MPDEPAHDVTPPRKTPGWIYAFAAFAIPILAGPLLSPVSAGAAAGGILFVLALAGAFTVGHRVRERRRYARQVVAREAARNEEEDRIFKETVKDVINQLLDRVRVLEEEAAQDRRTADERWRDTKRISSEEAARRLVERINHAPEGSYGAALREGVIGRGGAGRSKLATALQERVATEPDRSGPGGFSPRPRK